MDNLSREKRSKVMRSIRSKDTRPELIVRQCLRAAGVHYRLGGLKLPGRPDIVINKTKTAFFVNGCFWHMHDCRIFKMPTSRIAFWREKLLRNVARDSLAWDELTSRGWRVVVVWECATMSNEGLLRALRYAAYGPRGLMHIRGPA